MRRGFPALCVAALAAVSGSAVADDVAPTVTAAKEEVAFHLDLNGTFDAKDAVEVAFKPQVWGEAVEVVDARAAGPVAAGDVLVRFDTEKIDEAVRASERDLAIARAAFAVQAEDQARQLEATAAGLARTEFEARTAQENLEHFEKVAMPLRLEESDHQLQGTRNWISDQTEELAQLEKMYKADDLTEETEDIVLKRARRDLDRAKKSLDFQTRHDKDLREIELPREHESLQLEARRTSGARDRAVAVSRLQEAQAKLELDRAKANLDKQEKDAAKLASDRALFEVKAPIAGYAVPGTMLRGKWQNADDMKRALKKGGKFGPGSVLATIAPGGWRVATSVPEASLAWIHAGQDATVVATQAGVKPWAAKVGPVQPFTSGAEYPVDLEAVDASEGLLGMTCRIRVETGTRSVLLVPATAVEDGGFDKSVYVLADGKIARRTVALGQRADDRVEITSGLVEGEKVLVTAPKK